MTILTSSFYLILQYYNNHHPHIEDVLIIPSNISSVKFLFAAIIFCFFFDYSNADFERIKRGFAYILGTNHFL